MSKRNIIILLIVVILAGAFLRIFPVRYGSIRMYDIQLVTQAFDIGDGIIKGDFSVFKTPAKYPYFFSYLLLFFYGIFYFFGKLIGLFSSASQFVNYIFFHLDNFYDFARILMGIFGAALIPLIYIVTSKVVALKNKKQAKIAGLLAAFLMAFNLLHVHVSHQERPHILVSFFIFLSFYLFILFLEKRSLTRSLLLGLSIGLAAGSLHIGLIALLFFLLIIVFSRFRALASAKFWLGALVFLVIFVLCYPYVFLSFSQASHSQGTYFDFTLSGGKHIVGGLSSFTGQGFKSVINGLFFYSPVLMLIFILFFLVYLFKRRKRLRIEKIGIFSQALIGGISFIALYAFIFGMYNATHFRFLLPVGPFLCFFVGVLFSEIGYKFERRFLRGVFIGILALFLLFALIQTLRFDYLMFKQETRDLSREWIENNISKLDTVALECDDIRFVPDRESLQLQLALDPTSISRKDEFLFSLENKLYPKDSRSILNYWVFVPKENKYQFLEKHGARYFIISKLSLGDVSESGLEKEIISRGGKLVKNFSPFIKENSLRYSTFPAAFKNPILDLWALERLGPVIEIYKL